MAIYKVKRKKGHKYVARIYLATAMENLAIKSGVKRLGPHGLRHTFSAHYLMNGGDIFTLSKILGHASVNTTIRSYGHLSKEYLANAINIVSFGGKK